MILNTKTIQRICFESFINYIFRIDMHATCYYTLLLYPVMHLYTALGYAEIQHILFITVIIFIIG